MADNQDNGAPAPLTEQAKQQAQQVLQQGQSMAGHVWDLARNQFRSQLGGQKDRLGTSITDFANLLRQTGTQLGQQGQGGGGQMAERLADRVQQFGETVQQKDIQEILSDTEDFARSRPAAFLSIAALLGFILARFLKSSGQAVAA